MMIRYGLSFEDVLAMDKYVEAIDETEVIVRNEYYDLDEVARQPLARFVQ